MADHAREILEKIRNGTLTEQERILLESWYLQSQSDNNFEHSPEDFSHALEEIRTGILTEDQPFGRRKRQPWLYAAAAVILVGGISFLFRPAAERKNDLTQARTIHDVDPGTDKATLTLSDGSTLQLGNQIEPATLPGEAQALTLNKPGQLIYKPAYSGTSNPTGKPCLDDAGRLMDTGPRYNRISIPKGGQYKLILSDGTQVWLNAASSLRFPILFNAAYREVELSGEAYFEVSKKHVPFLVKTANQEIKVLGTHFDVNSYDDETSTKTTLLEGSVQVRPLHSDKSLKTQSRILRPGQQSRLDAGRLTISPVDVEEEVAWKNGSISFVNADIQSIMRQVSRWYNVDVVYSGAIPVRLSTGSISRNAKLSELLTILKLSKINFSIKGRQLTVSP